MKPILIILLFLTNLTCFALHEKPMEVKPVEEHIAAPGGPKIGPEKEPPIRIETGAGTGVPSVHVVPEKTGGPAITEVQSKPIAERLKGSFNAEEARQALISGTPKDIIALAEKLGGSIFDPTNVTNYFNLLDAINSLLVTSEFADAKDKLSALESLQAELVNRIRPDQILIAAQNAARGSINTEQLDAIISANTVTNRNSPSDALTSLNNLLDAIDKALEKADSKTAKKLNDIKNSVIKDFGQAQLEVLKKNPAKFFSEITSRNRLFIEQYLGRLPAEALNLIVSNFKPDISQITRLPVLIDATLNLLRSPQMKKTPNTFVNVGLSGILVKSLIESGSLVDRIQRPDDATIITDAFNSYVGDQFNKARGQFVLNTGESRKNGTAYYNEAIGTVLAMLSAIENAGSRAFEGTKATAIVAGKTVNLVEKFLADALSKVAVNLAESNTLEQLNSEQRKKLDQIEKFILDHRLLNVHFAQLSALLALIQAGKKIDRKWWEYVIDYIKSFFQLEPTAQELRQMATEYLDIQGKYSNIPAIANDEGFQIYIRLLKH